MINPLNLIGSLVSPVTDYLAKRDENKTQVINKKLERIQNAEDAAAAWELVQAENTGSSWKDEYITIIITAPIVTVFLAVLWSVYTGDVTAVKAAKEALTAVKELVPSYDDLLYIVVLAALGIKGLGQILRK